MEIRTKICWLALAGSMLVLGSCKEKKNDNIIITKPPTVLKPSAPKKMGDFSQSRSVNWLGETYTIETTLKADTALALASDGNTKYYDNRIRLHILKADGSTFLDREFVKSDFKRYVDAHYYDDGALLGVVFDKVDGRNLLFAVSVGSPDKSSDEFVPLEMKIDDHGGLTISESSTLDTNSDEE